jgi:flagellar basal-body rod modification protein FlgD
MASVDNVQVSTGTTATGQTYTSSVSNDKLTNNDFLKLMLQQMKLQDPTKPMDSQNMLNSQLQMSTIQTNLDMANSMKSLQQSFGQMNLSNATNVIGRLVEDNNMGQDGTPKSYKVASVELQNGEIVAKGYETTGLNADGTLSFSKDPTMINYTNITKIY